MRCSSKNQTKVATERTTTQEPLTDPEVRKLLKATERVIIARGKSRRDHEPAETRLDDLKGPTGNYRAPMIVAGRTLLVGFNAEALAELL